MNYKTWEERKAILETYAKQLDLTLAASGAVPINHLMPTVEMGDGTEWVCPHCGNNQTEMYILENESRSDTIEWEAPEGELMGVWSPKGDATGESETISYQCPACEGFVYPVEEVSW